MTARGTADGRTPEEVADWTVASMASMRASHRQSQSVVTVSCSRYALDVGKHEVGSRIRRSPPADTPAPKAACAEDEAYYGKRLDRRVSAQSIPRSRCHRGEIDVGRRFAAQCVRQSGHRNRRIGRLDIPMLGTKSAFRLGDLSSGPCRVCSPGYQAGSFNSQDSERRAGITERNGSPAPNRQPCPHRHAHAVAI